MFLKYPFQVLILGGFLLSISIHPALSSQTVNRVKRSLADRYSYVSEIIPSYDSIGYQRSMYGSNSRDSNEYYISKRVPPYSTPVYVPRYKSTYIDEGCFSENRDYYNKDWMNCGVYFTCVVTENTEAHLQYERVNYYCPDGLSFHAVSASCVDQPSCRRYYPDYPVSQGDLMCAQNRDKIYREEDCHDFYVCHYTDEFNAVDHYACNIRGDFCVKTTYFDDTAKICSDDHSSHDSPVRCKNGGERDRHPYPDDCTKYYQCVKIENQLTTIVKKCHEGYYYETKYKQCTDGTCEGTEAAANTTGSSTAAPSTEESKTTDAP